MIYLGNAPVKGQLLSLFLCSAFLGSWKTSVASYLHIVIPKQWPKGHILKMHLLKVNYKAYLSSAILGNTLQWV